MGKHIVTLDKAVINALELFANEKIPNLPAFRFKRPLVVGSGNALITGKIIFNNKDAIFADESSYKKQLKKTKDIDGAIIISSSGKKHAPKIAQYLRKKGLYTILLTNNNQALAKKSSNQTHVFPHNTEPYTYNTSTYLSMIFSKTKESPKNILSRIKNIKIPQDLREYDSYYFILPSKFQASKEMFSTKFDELFGSRVSARVFTIEQTKHAKTIVQSDKELFVSLGVLNKKFGTKRLTLPLSKSANFAELISVLYYFIGHIQQQNPRYFEKNIKRYVRKISKIFNQKIKPTQ